MNAKTWCTVPCVLLAVAILAVIVGGRTFGKLEITDHFSWDHPECRELKTMALDPNAHWDWVNTLRGPCGIFKDPYSGAALVIVLLIIGHGAKATIRLITGYTPDRGIDEWTHRPSNRCR